MKIQINFSHALFYFRDKKKKVEIKNETKFRNQFK